MYAGRLQLLKITVSMMLAAALLPAAHAPTRLRAASLRHSDAPTLPPDSLPALCPAFDQLQSPAGCSALGPGAYAERISAAGLPYPLPPVTLTPVRPDGDLAEFAYAKIITDTAPVYRHPLEALHGLPPMRQWEPGFDFVSVQGQTTVEGAQFVQINPGEFMRAEDLEEVQPSGFAGQYFAAAPGALVGWVITRVQPSLVPGQAPAPDAPFLGRYQFFHVLGAQRVGDWNWYLIGPDQWVEQRSVGVVPPTPPGGAGGTLIAVDTYEQALGVYQNGGLIFATLVSSGSKYFPTREGTFQVWARLTHGKMSGTYRDDRSDYYFLEDVPWILYYDGARALHGAYWHDHFGTRSSHGCVNLSPRDARWLYDFARVGSTVVVFSSQ